VKHGIAHQQHRNRGDDREDELVQDVRQYPVGTVMGVVDSFRMTPFCRSSVFRFTVPKRLAVITAIAMMPGMKNSMNRYFL